MEKFIYVTNITKIMDLTYIKNQLQQRRDEIAADEARNVLRLEKRREKDIHRITDQYHSEIEKIRGKFEAEKQSVQQAYVQRASGEVLQSLREDFQVIHDRAEAVQLFSISAEDYKKGQRTYEALQELDNDRIKKLLLDALDPVTKSVVTLLERGAGELNGLHIHSYITCRGNKCYLLSPIKPEAQIKGDLADSLEDKLTEVLGLGSIIPENTNAHSAIIGRIKYSAEPDEINGYLVHIISSENAERLQGALKAKLENANIQPPAFSKAKLTHKIVCLDFEIFDYFKAHSAKEMYSVQDVIENLLSRDITEIPISQAEEITGYSARGLRILLTKKILLGDRDIVQLDSLLRYFAKDKYRVVKEVAVHASNRQGYGAGKSDAELAKIVGNIIEDLTNVNQDFLSVKEAAELLHLDDTSINYKVVSKVIPASKNGALWSIPKQSLIDFVNTYTLTNGGWRKKKS